MEFKANIQILIFALFCFYSPASLRGEILHFDYLQGSMKQVTVCGSGGVADPNKFSHPSSGGAGDHHPGSQSPNVNGGGGAIPLYAANDRRHNNPKINHSGSSRRHNDGVELVILGFTVLACFLLRRN